MLLHTIDLNLKKRKSEEKRDDETKEGIRVGAGRNNRKSERETVGGGERVRKKERDRGKLDFRRLQFRLPHISQHGGTPPVTSS